MRRNFGYLVLVLFVALACTLPGAFADSVYVCEKPGSEGTPYLACCVNRTDCGKPEGGQVVLTTTPKPDDLVPVGQSTKLGRGSFWYYTPVITWRKWSTVTDSTIVGICAGNETDVERCAYGNGGNSSLQVRSAIAGISTPAPTQPMLYRAPLCVPNSLTPKHLLIGYGSGAACGVWFCDTPTGIETQSVCGGKTGEFIAKVGKFLLLSDEKLLEAHKQFVNREQTDTEHELVIALFNSAGIKARVYNPGSTTAPTYARNPDGTKGKEMKVRAKVGDECNFEKRLTGTDYFAVVGGVWDLAFGSHPYARCKVEGPISK